MVMFCRLTTRVKISGNSPMKRRMKTAGRMIRYLN
jgi:hypothetical protein